MDHIFIADTNLFFECKGLEELPWAELGVDPVVIALTKPVIGEIDKHKKAGGRTRKRALEMSKRIRGMLAGGIVETVIREACPRVVLQLLPIIKPDLGLEQSLDYTQNDDRIIGIVAALKREQSYTEVTFLSDDSVASSTALSLGLSYWLIPESWKRPPEETTEAKRIKELEKDLSAYKAQEPRIELRDATSPGGVRVVRRVPAPLAKTEIDRLVEDLRTRNPMQASFDPPPAESLADGTEISYKAPDAEAVEKYKSEDYPSWLVKCRSILENLHEGRIEAEPTLRLTVGLINAGTRPASSLRISFEARGNIYLRRADNEDDEDRETPAARAVPPSIPRLPAPPAAPEIRKIVRQPAPPVGLDISSLRVPTPGLRIADLGLSDSTMQGLSGVSAALARFEDMMKMSEGYRLPESLTHMARVVQDHERLFSSSALGWANASSTLIDRPFDYPALVSPAPARRDPELFYYDDWRPGIPVKSSALTCELFRHQDKEELFVVEVVFPPEGDTNGAVHCKVQAKNLTEPVTLTIPVSRIVETFDLLAAAEGMAANCRGAIAAV